jgi:hypothetical protein
VVKTTNTPNLKPKIGKKLTTVIVLFVAVVMASSLLLPAQAAIQNPTDYQIPLNSAVAVDSEFQMSYSIYAGTVFKAFLVRQVIEYCYVYRPAPLNMYMWCTHAYSPFTAIKEIDFAPYWGLGGISLCADWDGIPNGGQWDIQHQSPDILTIYNMETYQTWTDGCLAHQSAGIKFAISYYVDWYATVNGQDVFQWRDYANSGNYVNIIDTSVSFENDYGSYCPHSGPGPYT